MNLNTKHRLDTTGCVQVSSNKICYGPDLFEVLEGDYREMYWMGLILNTIYGDAASPYGSLEKGNKRAGSLVETGSEAFIQIKGGADIDITDFIYNQHLELSHRDTLREFIEIALSTSDVEASFKKLADMINTKVLRHEKERVFDILFKVFPMVKKKRVDDEVTYFIEVYVDTEENKTFSFQHKIKVN